MSYDVELRDPSNKVCIVVPHAEGGTYVCGGTDRAELNVTYNYGEHFHHTLGDGGLRSLNGQRAGDTIPILTAAVEILGTTQDADYWKPTPGNAGYALNILLQWAKVHPDAHWVIE